MTYYHQNDNEPNSDKQIKVYTDEQRTAVLTEESNILYQELEKLRQIINEKN